MLKRIIDDLDPDVDLFFFSADPDPHQNVMDSKHCFI